MRFNPRTQLMRVLSRCRWKYAHRPAEAEMPLASQSCCWVSNGTLPGGTPSRSSERRQPLVNRIWARASDRPMPRPLKKHKRLIKRQGRFGVSKSQGDESLPAMLPEVQLLAHGLYAGDLESILLTVLIAVDENRVTCCHETISRIIAFLSRLSEYDSILPKK